MILGANHIIRAFPPKPTLYDTSRQTVIIANDHTKWGRTVQLSTDNTLLFRGSPTVQFSSTAEQDSPYSWINFPAVDLSSADYFELWWYVPTVSGFSGTQEMALYSGDSYFDAEANVYQANINPVLFPANGYKDAGWRRVRVSKADFAVEKGTPNWANINGLYFSIGKAADQSIAWNIARVDAVSVGKGIVSLDFDDGSDTAFTQAYPIMEEYGLRGTVYVITGNVGNAGNMTWAQLRELKEAGWTIACHTDTHPDLTTLTEAQIATEFDISQAKLRQHGFLAGSYFLAAPGGTWNAACRAQALTRFISVRIERTYPVYDPVPLDDNYIAKYKSVENTDTPASLKDIVDTIEASARWHHFVFHQIVDPATAATQYTPTDFEELCTYIAARRDAGGIIVPTAEEAFLQFTGYETEYDGQHCVLTSDGNRPVVLRLNRG